MRRGEHQECESFLRDPDLTCIPSHPIPQDEVPASASAQTLAHLPEATGLGRKIPGLNYHPPPSSPTPSLWPDLAERRRSGGRAWQPPGHLTGQQARSARCRHNLRPSVRLGVGADYLRPISVGLPGAPPTEGAGHRAQRLALSRDPRHLDLISNPFSLLYGW